MAGFNNTFSRTEMPLSFVFDIGPVSVKFFDTSLGADVVATTGFGSKAVSADSVESLDTSFGTTSLSGNYVE